MLQCPLPIFPVPPDDLPSTSIVSNPADKADSAVCKTLNSPISRFTRPAHAQTSSPSPGPPSQSSRPPANGGILSPPSPPAGPRVRSRTRRYQAVPQGRSPRSGTLRMPSTPRAWYGSPARCSDQAGKPVMEGEGLGTFRIIFIFPFQGENFARRSLGISAPFVPTRQWSSHMVWTYWTPCASVTVWSVKGSFPWVEAKEMWRLGW